MSEQTIGTIYEVKVDSGHVIILVNYTKDGEQVGHSSFTTGDNPGASDRLKQWIAEQAKEYDDVVPVDKAAEEAAEAQEAAEKQTKIDALTIKEGDIITAADLVETAVK